MIPPLQSPTQYALHGHWQVTSYVPMNIPMVHWMTHPMDSFGPCRSHAPLMAFLGVQQLGDLLKDRRIAILDCTCLPLNY